MLLICIFIIIILGIIIVKRPRTIIWMGRYIRNKLLLLLLLMPHILRTNIVAMGDISYSTSHPCLLPLEENGWMLAWD